MKKYLFFMLVCLLGASAFGQTRLSLRSVNKAECEKSDYSSLKATFSFSGVEATEINSDRGVFSTLTMPNTVIGGEEGAPQIPVVSKLIAVPVGATPSIRVTSYSTTDYDLEEYGIHRLSPRQPNVRKDEAARFVYNEAAYQTRGLRSEPLARVSVDGTMRGVQVGRMSIEPVSYDPVNNKIRVFNDIKVEVVFDGADARATEDQLVRTYSPYFDVLYKQLFNGRTVRDVYDEHPDLWHAPVKMLVIANRMFENCIQDWVAWKTMKGIYVDVNYTDEIGTSVDAIKTFIQNKYAEDAPTFLVIMGDKDQVVPSINSASETSCVSDLYYSSVDGDEFVDMYHSRMSAETTDQMTSLINKGMEYEKYLMPDPSYLNNVLLIAGQDDGWGITVGRPTIWYATNYYYNAEHGFDNVYEFSHGDYTNCYAPLSSGVGFANYTAHGSKTSWAGPEFNVDDVANLTNAHKYFLAIGNCCQSGDWGYSTTCFGEAMVRAENKGAYAYIGSCPNTTWKNDYYFGVGPTNRADGTMPTYEETGLGIYDAIWLDDVYNTVNSILYVGLLAGNAAGALGYELHSETLYYWQAYHVLGDGSIMPYRVQPTANNVSHMAILPIGMNTYEVSAVPGSYVAISKDGVLLGAALVDETGTVQVPITPVTDGGDVTICVTAPQRIPYIQTVPAAALEGAYLAVDSYTPTATHVGDNTELSIIFKNVGTAATTGNTNINLTSDDPNVTVDSPSGSFGALAADASTTVSGFQFHINPGVADGTNVTIHYTATNGEDTYEGNIVVKANEAVLEYKNMSWNGGFVPGETLTLTAKFKNTGHYQATNAVVTMSSTSELIDIAQPNVNVGTMAVDQEVSCQFEVTIADNCLETSVIPVTFTMTADGGLTAQGNETLKNSCNVIFELHDSYSGNDGWNGANLVVSFDDGTPSENLTIQNGYNSATYTLEIGNGTHVTLTWSSGSYDGECTFTVSYEGNLIIYSQSTRPSAGVLYEFDCNCAAASQTFTVTATSSNTEQGTVSGGGEFSYGQTCTLTATPADGYMFTNWTQNGEVVSTASTYSFLVHEDLDLVAHFVEGLMIGDGSVATNSYLPSTSYYNYTVSQQIYTAEELGSAGIITSIAFYNGGSEKTRKYDLYMKATTKSTFSDSQDWEQVSESDKVFSGEVTMVANDWITFTFNSPFFYNGVSNIVLVADDNTGSWESGLACRVFSASNQSLFVYSDNTNYDPFNPSSYSGTLSSEKNQIIVTKEAFSTDTFNIMVSANNIRGGTVSGGGEFSMGDICTVTAVPNDNFVFEGWMENETIVSHDSTYSFTVVRDRDLVAIFNENVVIGGGTETNVYLPSYSYYDYSISQQIYTADEIGTAGIVNSISFYNGGAEKTRNYDFYLVATDKASFDSSTDWVNITEADKVFSGDVTMTADEWTTITFDSPFIYDGTSNLVLVADDNSNEWSNSPHMACRVFEAESQAIYAYRDNNDFVPSSLSEYDGTILNVKNQIMFGITTGCHFITAGNWSDENNWLANYMPDDNSDVTIEANCQLDVDATIAILSVNRGCSLSVLDGQILVADSIFTTAPSQLVIKDGGQMMSQTETLLTVEKDITGYGTGQGNYYLISNPLWDDLYASDVEGLIPSNEADFDLYYFYNEGENLGEDDDFAYREWLNYKADPFPVYYASGYLYANKEDVTLRFAGTTWPNYDTGLRASVSYDEDTDAPFGNWALTGNLFSCNGYLVYTDEDIYLAETNFYVMNEAGDDLELSETQVALSPCQGAFIEIPYAGYLYFLTYDPGFSKTGALNITLTQGQGKIDQARVRFGEGRNLGKLSLREKSLVYIPMEGKDLAVAYTGNKGEMPVSFKAKESGSYTLSFNSEAVNFSHLHLIDTLTGAEIDLLQTPTYTFEASTTDNPNRFKVVFVSAE